MAREVSLFRRVRVEVAVNDEQVVTAIEALTAGAKEAGGWGSCGDDVFKDKQDPDYQRMLTAIELGKQYGNQRPRYGTPGFRPNRQYIRELKKYGVLAADFDPDTTPIDFFAADQAYWRTYWLDQPED